MKERIVITGAGIITSAGQGVEAHHQSLMKGGVQFKPLKEVIDFYPFTLNQIDQACHEVLVSAVEKNNSELAELAGLNPKKFDRHQIFAHLAAKEAMAGIEIINHERFACIGATGGAGLLDLFQSALLSFEMKRLLPSANLKYLPNLFVGYLAKEFNLKGPSHVHGTACAASMHALFDLVRLIQLDRVDGGLVVGTEAAISSFGIASFNSQRALGNGLAYQRDRSGFVMGEGAAALVVERESVATERGANILAVVSGYGESTDGTTDGAITDPSPLGASRAIKEALTDAGLELLDIDLIKTHGTATPKGDSSELEALLEIESGKNSWKVPVLSLKSYFGHLLGAAGIAEIVSVSSLIKHQMVLPTRGLNPANLDPACSTAKHNFESQELLLEHVLCNGFGFGGTNASVVISKYN